MKRLDFTLKQNLRGAASCQFRRASSVGSDKKCCSPRLCQIRVRTTRTIATTDTSSDKRGRTNACSASPRCRFLSARPFLTCGGKSGAIRNAWFERARYYDADERQTEPAAPERDGRRRCGLLSLARE